MGGATTATLALVVVAAGVGVIAAWPTLAGLVVGTIVFAGGMSLMYPALLILALHGVSDADRASVVGTFSSFFDASQGLGAFICGAVVAFAGDRGAFVTGTVCALAGLAVLRARSGSRTAPAHAARVGCRRAVVAGDQRLPAQARRNPVVSLRAVAPAPARRDHGA